MPQKVIPLVLLLLLCACDETPGEYPSMIYTSEGAVLRLPQPAMVSGDVPRLEEAVAFWPCMHLGDGLITAEVNFVPDGDWGQAHITANKHTGRIAACHIVVSSDIAYDHDTVEAVLVHELGHCAGLADDPGVESIMASPPGWLLRSEDRDACP